MAKEASAHDRVVLPSLVRGESPGLAGTGDPLAITGGTYAGARGTADSTSTSGRDEHLTLTLMP